MREKRSEADPAAPVRKVDASAGSEERCLASLAALSERLQRVREEADASRAFIDCIGGSSAVSRAALYLAASPGEPFEMRESHRLDGARSLPPIGAGSSFARWIARVAGAASIDDFFAAGGAGKDDETFLGPLVEAGCSIAAPLLSGGRLAGALVCSPRRADRAVRNDDVPRDRFLVAACSLLAGFLAGARSSRELDVLQRVSAVKRGALDGACRELRSGLRMLGSTLSSLESDGPGDALLVDMARDAVAGLEKKASFALELGGAGDGAARGNVEKIEVRSLVDDALREAIPELEEKEITVDTVDGTVFRPVRVDREAMATALRCVLDGVVAFVPRGGIVRISLALAVDDGTADEGIAIAPRPGIASGGRGPQSRGETLASVTIAGEGIVMPGVDAAALADPYAVAFSAADARVRALGVALATASAIVARHDGVFLATYDAGRVAAFTMRLPVVE